MGCTKVKREKIHCEVSHGKAENPVVLWKPSIAVELVHVMFPLSLAIWRTRIPTGQNRIFKIRIQTKDLHQRKFVQTLWCSLSYMLQSTMEGIRQEETDNQHPYRSTRWENLWFRARASRLDPVCSSPRVITLESVDPEGTDGLLAAYELPEGDYRQIVEQMCSQGGEVLSPDFQRH